MACQLSFRDCPGENLLGQCKRKGSCGQGGGKGRDMGSGRRSVLGQEEGMQAACAAGDDKAWDPFLSFLKEHSSTTLSL